jgi:hypothetical protein
MDQLEMGFESPVELEGIDPVDPVELQAPLDGSGANVPHPAAHVGQRLPFLNAGINLGQCRLGQVLFGQIPRDDDDRDVRLDDSDPAQ